MDCRQVEELIDAHALDALDKSDKKLVERHLTECGDCRIQFESSSRVAALLPLSAPLHEAPPGLFNKTMSDIYRDLAANEPEAEKVRWFTPTWFSRYGTAAAAAAASLVAFASLGFALSLNDDVEDTDNLATSISNVARDQQLVNLALASDDRRAAEIEPEPGRADQTSAIYVWSPKYSVGVLIVDGIEELDGGLGYLTCFETREAGIHQVAGSMDLYDGHGQKAFWIVQDDPIVAVGLTAEDSCNEGGDPETEWRHYWRLSNPR
jgi:Putative zinc-finger